MAATKFWLGRINPFCAYINLQKNHETVITLKVFDSRWKG